jgi:hypothetical protein
LSAGGFYFSGGGVTVMDEDGEELRCFVVFDEEAKKDAGANYIGRWDGGIAQRVTCDPVRETLYFELGPIFDLWTGNLLGRWDSANHRGAGFHEAQFDKRGYMHYLRVWLDWHKRSFVPEAYRHLIGVLDANGNSILHLGQYGNFDDGLQDKR